MFYAADYFSKLIFLSQKPHGYYSITIICDKSASMSH